MAANPSTSESHLDQTVARQWDTLFTDLNEAWADLLAALAAIPAADQEGPGGLGAWSVKDLLGHLAAWDRANIGLAGAALTPMPLDAIGTFNAGAATAGTGLSLAAQRAELAAAHEALLADLRAAAARGVVPPLTCACGHHAIADHYREHTADLRAWRRPR